MLTRLNCRKFWRRKFLGLIDDARMLPDAICFYADGVKLVCEGSPVLAELDALERSRCGWWFARRAWITSA